MFLIRRAIVALLAACMAAGPGLAQSTAEFVDAFAGDWYIFDPAMGQGSEPCTLMLKKGESDDVLPASVRTCAAALATIDRWLIRDGRIILSNARLEVASIGGNQFRLTGDLNETDTTVVIERAQGDGNSAKIAAALRKHRCFFVGFTQQCATPAELAVPQIGPGQDFITITTLVTLNARAQPRSDAPSLGRVAEGTDVKVNQCLTASDGGWCRAVVGENTIWLAMTAVRQNEWPILTYRRVKPLD